MILLLWLSAVGHAASCCGSAGLSPGTLATCDSAALSFGLGGDMQTGGWSWGGAWSAVGDDGGGGANASATALGRFQPWLQGGLRVPLILSLDALDGQTQTDLAVGRVSGWLELETPDGMLGPRAPWLALEIGLGADDPHQHALLGTVALHAGLVRGVWGAYGGAYGRAPVLGESASALGLDAVVDRSLRGRLRLGLGANATARPGRLAAFSTEIGPAFAFQPGLDDRITVSARAGPPLRGAGWNAPSQAQITASWTHVLYHSEAH